MFYMAVYEWKYENRGVLRPFSKLCSYPFIGLYALNSVLNKYGIILIAGIKGIFENYMYGVNPSTDFWISINKFFNM